MSNWRELVAHYVASLATTVGTVAIINATDIREQANVIKSQSTDTSSVEASEIAQKIRDDITKNHPGITISGSV